jgi:hypothetical protein
MHITGDLVHTDHYLDGFVFRTIVAIGLQQCARECLLKRRCQSFNYQKDMLKCELNAVNSTTHPHKHIQLQGYSYSDKISWPKVRRG